MEVQGRLPVPQLYTALMQGMPYVPGLPAEEPEVPLVLDAREVEVGEVAPVVDDPLCVGVGEPDAREGRELERRLAVGGLSEADFHRAHPTRARG